MRVIREATIIEAHSRAGYPQSVEPPSLLRGKLTMRLVLGRTKKLISSCRQIDHSPTKKEEAESIQKLSYTRVIYILRDQRKI